MIPSATEISDKIILLLEILPYKIFNEQDLELCESLSTTPEQLSEVIQELEETDFLGRENNGEFFSILQKKKKKKVGKEKEEKDNISYNINLLTFLQKVNSRGDKSPQKEEEINRQKFNGKYVIKPKPKPLVQDVSLPMSIEELVDFWNSLGLKKCWKNETRVFQETILSLKRARSGKLFEKSGLASPGRLTNEEIKESIRRFYLAVRDPNYNPTIGSPYQMFLSKMMLIDFLHNQRGKSTMSKSYMLYYLRNEPILLNDSPIGLPNNHPEITKILKNFYIDKVLGGEEFEPNFNEIEKEKFILASIKIVEFFEKHKDTMNLQFFGIYDEIGFTSIVCSCIEKDNKDKMHKITPGFFCSDTTFNRRLPSYLYKEGLINKPYGN